MNVLAYARLMRLPNVFTALADVGVGVFASGLYAADPLAALLLAVASASLYTAGMVSNDCFDLAEDQRERPFRPLPAGQISLRTAQLLTVGLMLVGVAAAMASGATGLASTTDGSTTGVPTLTLETPSMPPSDRCRGCWRSRWLWPFCCTTAG
jgi:4-hydroxybenzoate polyprenyltransferase